MCDTNLEPATELDKEVKLNCTAVGPATLSVEWTASQGKFAGLNCYFSLLQVIADYCRLLQVQGHQGQVIVGLVNLEVGFHSYMGLTVQVVGPINPLEDLLPTGLI